MNHRIILSYLCVISFFAFLAFAYSRYSGKTSEQQDEELKQNIIAAIRNDIGGGDQSLNAKQIEDIVKTTIKNNPEIIIQAVDSYQMNRAQMQKAQIADKIKELRDVITNNPKDPRVGHANPKVKIVEFFDYSCGYCRKMFTINQQLLQNPDIQFVFKETPILGEASFIASRISLAVYNLNPSKYLQFQQALWNDGNRTQEHLIKLAVDAGISETDLINLLNDKDKIAAIDEGLVANQQLAVKMNIEGTPSYVIGDQFIPGATSYDQMNKIVQDIISQTSNPPMNANEQNKAGDKSKNDKLPPSAAVDQVARGATPPQPTPVPQPNQQIQQQPTSPEIVVIPPQPIPPTTGNPPSSGNNNQESDQAPSPPPIDMSQVIPLVAPPPPTGSAAAGN